MISEMKIISAQSDRIRMFGRKLNFRTQNYALSECYCYKHGRTKMINEFLNTKYAGCEFHVNLFSRNYFHCEASSLLFALALCLRNFC